MITLPWGNAKETPEGLRGCHGWMTVTSSSLPSIKSKTATGQPSYCGKEAAS